MLAASVKARGRGDVTGIGINMTTTRSSRGEKSAYFTCWIFECVIVVRTPHAVCVEVGVEGERSFARTEKGWLTRVKRSSPGSQGRPKII